MGRNDCYVARGRNCWGVLKILQIVTAYCIPHIMLLSLCHYCLRFEIIVQQKMLSLFLKRLANLTRRRVSHQAGLMKQALKHHSEPPAKNKSSTPQGFWDDWLRRFSWLILEARRWWHKLLFDALTWSSRGHGPTWLDLILSLFFCCCGCLKLGMGIAKKCVSRYITIRDQRIAIHITIHFTRFNLCVRMVLLCFQLKKSTNILCITQATI